MRNATQCSFRSSKVKKKMKIYVSAVTDAKAKAARFVARVQEIGGTITRDWSSASSHEIGSLEEERASAEETRAAILAADFVVAFLAKNRNGTGLHTEIGMALAYSKRVLIVGRSLPRRGVLMLADRAVSSAVPALEELHAWMHGKKVPLEIRERWVAEDEARHAAQANGLERQADRSVKLPVERLPIAVISGSHTARQQAREPVVEVVHRRRP